MIRLTRALAYVFSIPIYAILWTVALPAVILAMLLEKYGEGIDNDTKWMGVMGMEIVWLFLLVCIAVSLR